MRKKQQRLNQLIHILQKQPKFSIRELARELNVSEMTIRRDLAYLETSSLLCTSPQVSPLAFTSLSPASPSSSAKGDAALIQIGQAAASLIQEEDILFVDSGVAAVYLCRFIPPSINVTIICYDFNVLSLIHDKPNISVIFCGGRLQKDSSVFISTEGLELVKHHRADKAFFSAEGLHPTLGVTCKREYLAPIKRAAVSASACKILLAESHIFSKIQPSFFLPTEEIDMVVTDVCPSEYWQTLLKEKILL